MAVDAMKTLTEIDLRLNWLVRARAWAEFMWLRKNRPLSVEDIREVCPLPRDIDPRIMGHVFERNKWEPVDWTVASKHCHKRPVRLFRRKPL